MLGLRRLRGDRASSSPTSAARWRTSARRRSSATSTARRRPTRRSRRSSSPRRCWRRSGPGAIVAIEREIGLRNYIESGIPLDAELTYDLLVTIFQPGSPLHDGAVVLQEDRVAAAACFLPLTVNPRVSRELGTRHRAAIGLTEESDAAAIVVSEETGQIALALDGAIERGLSADELRDRLRTLIMQRRAGRRGAAPAYDV